MAGNKKRQKEAAAASAAAQQDAREALAARIRGLRRQQIDDGEPYDPGPTLTDRRVLFLVEMQQNGTYRSGYTDTFLAQQWDLSVDYVRKLAKIARSTFSALVQINEEDRDALLGSALAAFERLAAQAEREGTANGAKASADIIALRLSYQGFVPVKKLEVSGKDGAALPSVILIPPEDPEPEPEVDEQQGAPS